MFTTFRKVAALSLVVAAGTTGVAVGGPSTAADLNDAAVDGKITPNRLPAQRFKPVSLFTGVRNSLYTSGSSDQQNPASEFIAFSKNIKVDLRGVPKCPTIAPGTPTSVARDQCPGRSYLGSGVAEVRNPNNPTGDPLDQTVSVFHGPDQNDLQLHTYGELGGGSPIVPAAIVDAPGTAWGKALSVPVTPETGTLLITKFNATLLQSKDVVFGRCNPRSFRFRRTVTYKDGSSESVSRTQACRVRR